jgi:glycosyltransferase involved in cell wall biosynthesis
MPIKLVDLSFHLTLEFTKPEQALAGYKEALGYIDFIKDRLDFSYVNHISYEGEKLVAGVRYSFFKRWKYFWYIPFKTNRFVKSLQPDIVLAQGLVFPLQVIALKFTLGRKPKIIVQHHGERPFKAIKKVLQKLADRYIDAYLFTSIGNAQEWLDEKIIKHSDKCAEVLEASTYFKRQNKTESKKRLGLSGNLNFLWVGRLNANKDPLTVLAAFKNFSEINLEARLYMIYQTQELLGEIKAFIENYPLLKQSVILMGKVIHSELPYWYSAANFYVSASYKEGSGYALLEAMACGCIPIVTNIPSFRKITEAGEYGFLYEAGNVDELSRIFSSLPNAPTEELSNKVEAYSKNNLSFKNIADDIYSLCVKLMAK